MDLDFLTLCLAITIPICLGMWIKHRERFIELKAMSRQGEQRESSPEMAALQAEVARLRDTTTKYDMSVERALEDIRQRLDSIEQHGRKEVQPAPAQRQDEQTVGLTAGVHLES